MNEPREGNQKEYENFSNQCKIIIGRILDHFNGIFTSITETRCRSCIKLLYTTDQMYVYTLARDQGSHQSCSQLDTKRVRGNHDPLKDNPQFARLFSDAEDVWHFISNDLTKDHAFHSTSMSAYKPERAHRFPAMLGAWPLPYRSAITAAIRQGPFDLCHERSEVLGFLSVDSESRGVFEERWDVEILFAVADALYHPLRSYLDAQNRPSSPLPIPGPEDV